jgi:hypothetical protein
MVAKTIKCVGANNSNIHPHLLMDIITSAPNPTTRAVASLQHNPVNGRERSSRQSPQRFGGEAVT